ncbi:MAG: CRTAC1 family protein [Planctomycetota bacterium]|nr:CRTAC1 family protein [Planctomycetota bacterium]
MPLSPGAYGNGMCGADFDGDGDIDLVIPGPPGSPIQYFRNDGQMSFTELTSQAGLGSALAPHGVGTADIDNDGDPDVLVGNALLPIQLFINNGAGQFTEEAQQRGLLSQTSVYAVTFGDYDRDGWLDVYLGNRDAAGVIEDNILYRNVGQGSFVDVTTTAGANNLGLTCAAAFLDYNEDGWPDIFCANDKGYLYLPNTILHNNGDGTFTDLGGELGVAQEMDSMGIDFADVFNDGGMDIYVSDTVPNHLFLQWDLATDLYVDDTYTYNLAGGGFGWAVNWLDFDNDGWQDLHVVQSQNLNLLFRNPAAPASAQAGWLELGVALHMAPAYRQFTALIADLDDDGRVDIINRYSAYPLFQPPTGCSVHQNTVAGGNWLRFLTRGVASNRDGLGARIEVVTGNQRQRQYVRSGTGYLSGNDRRVHFGMGNAAQAGRVEIFWPSGQVQVLENIATNQTFEVIEPSFQLTGPATVGGTTSLALSVQGEGALPYAMVLSFSETPRTLLPDGRELPVLLDALSGYTIIPGNALLPSSLGLLNPSGQAASALVMPAQPALTGLVMFATAATFNPPGFPNVRTIFPTAVEIVAQ